MIKKTHFLKRFKQINLEDALLKISLILIVICGFLLRFRSMSESNLWADELIRINWYNSNLEYAITADYLNNVNTIRFFMWFLYLFFPETIFWTRFPLVLFSSLTIILVYLACKEIGNPRGGILASLIIALSPLSIRYSTEVSFYPILEFLVIYSIYSTLWFDRTKDIRGLYTAIFSLIIISANPLGFGVIASCTIYLWSIEFTHDKQIGMVLSLRNLLLSKTFRLTLWPIILTIYAGVTIITADVGTSVRVVPTSYDYLMTVLVYWNFEIYNILKTIIPIISIILPLIIFKSITEHDFKNQLILGCGTLTIAVLIFYRYLSGGAIQGRYLIVLCPILSIIIPITLFKFIQLLNKYIKLQRFRLGMLIENVTLLVVVIILVNSSFNIIEETHPRAEYIKIIDDLNKIKDSKIISSPENHYWETTASLNSVNSLQIIRSEWSYEELNMNDCSLIDDINRTFLIVAERHNLQLDIELELMQGWKIVNSSYYYGSAWYEIEAKETWRVECDR